MWDSRNNPPSLMHRTWVKLHYKALYIQYKHTFKPQIRVMSYSQLFMPITQLSVKKQTKVKSWAELVYKPKNVKMKKLGRSTAVQYYKLRFVSDHFKFKNLQTAPLNQHLNI